MPNRVVETSKSTSSLTAIIDEEFGSIVCRRSSKARFVRIRVSEQGEVRASLPKRAPIYLVRELVDSSREQIRKLVEEQTAKRTVYQHGMNIGHSHTLSIQYDDIDSPQKKLRGQLLVITIPLKTRETDTETQRFISQHVKQALRREAKAYLPRRLRYLADTYGFDYARERFGHQTGRWGSCSSSGTISLNVALMNLSHELIDYVLIHELAHTRQMNHSASFWEIVERCLPNYKELRKSLKSMSPIC